MYLKKYDRRVWAGRIWPRIKASKGLLRIWQCSFRAYKMQGISSVPQFHQLINTTATRYNIRRYNDMRSWLRPLFHRIFNVFTELLSVLNTPIYILMPKYGLASTEPELSSPNQYASQKRPGATNQSRNKTLQLNPQTFHIRLCFLW